MKATSKPYPSVRLFQNPILESLSHVHPVVPALWGVPVVFLNLLFATEQGGLGWVASWFLAGLFIWTLSEYVLHRYVFHFHATSKFGSRIVYLFHGIHHEDPNDPTRLVMPPIAAWVLASLFFVGFSLILGSVNVNPFFAGFITGYLIYDYIHYATHHWRMNSKVGAYLKKHHMRHHFAEQDIKWGVSSPLWDFVFGTYKK